MSNCSCQSKTSDALMRAYTGEALTCARYKLAEKQCRSQQIFMLANLFKFTAAQEKIHLEVFHKHLCQQECGEIKVCADFPAGCQEDPLQLLRRAAEGEEKEGSEVYPAFAEAARSEGSTDIARDFENIAAVEKAHGQRFTHYADLLDGGKLFASEQPEKWLCLNCGYLHEGTSAPETCPVCAQPQGWYIRLCESPWGLCTGGEGKC